MKSIPVSIFVMILSYQTLGQSSFDGLYFSIQKSTGSTDTVDHSYLLSLLKVSGNTCFMDIINVLIIGRDTIPVAHSKRSKYLKGQCTILAGKLNLTFREIIIDYFERIIPLNEEGMPTVNGQLSSKLGEIRKEGILIDGTLFKRAAYNKTLTSEETKNL